MLVYGDHCEKAEPASIAAAINRQLDLVERMPSGLARHSRLVSALVEAGRLLQGVADADFSEACCDRRTAVTDALGGFLLQLATAVCRSWSGGSFGSLSKLAPQGDWPPTVDMRVPEGFAYYAVYPEVYAEAARRLKLSGAPRVIGIRSIGTTLGAVVAASLGAPPPVTVRPFGDPFARGIALDAALERELLEGNAHYVIVDEGPGQSGSSFGAVSDWLTERGVTADRIALLPSHAGAPGPAATDHRRRWWARIQREAGDVGDRWPELIGKWCSQSIGELDDLPLDISAGSWRSLRYDREEDWPAIVSAWERRKFLVRAGGKPFVAKFSGLGRIGEEKLAIARGLHSEGLVPEPVGLAHGFLVEHWRDDAVPLAADAKPLREIARYIGTRAKLLPAPSGSGASVEALLAMARRNISVEFGDEFTPTIDAWSGREAELARRVVRVRTDNRLDRHEWLRCRSGALLKADALDHHCAHDLIGCQDVAWDVAGAIVEFDVNQVRRPEFIPSVEHFAGREIDRALLDFYGSIYLAFRLGQARLGAAMVAASDRRRIDRAGDRYADRLRQLLTQPQRTTRYESSLG